MAEDEAEVADAAIPSAGAGAVAAEETAEVLETLFLTRLVVICVQEIKPYPINLYQEGWYF